MSTSTPTSTPIGTDPVNGAVAQHAAPLIKLLDVLEGQQPDLFGHGESVARNCVSVGRALGLSSADVDALFIAGKLHDVGKAGIDEAVLRKPGPLTGNEWRQVQMHPLIGANLHFACGLGMIGEWILAHHERPDGRGYPYGLPATQIPLPAKILAAADAYDAMRTNRVYREALTPDQASAELSRRAGDQFDEAVVEILLAIT